MQSRCEWDILCGADIYVAGRTYDAAGEDCPERNRGESESTDTVVDAA